MNAVEIEEELENLRAKVGSEVNLILVTGEITTEDLLGNIFSKFCIRKKKIKTKEDYKTALTRFEKIFDAIEGTPEGDEAFLLGLLIASYGEENFPINDPNPIDYIDARLDALGLKRQDLDGVIAKGSSHVSEVMNRKRALSLDAIRALEDRFNMDPKILIQRYPVEASGGSPSRKSAAEVRAGIASEVLSSRTGYTGSKKVSTKSRKVGSLKKASRSE